MPGRKKKCPACGNAIFVRTRPQDKVRILVRSDQLLVVEEQWSIVRGTHHQFLAAQRLREATASDYEDGQRQAMGKELTRELTNGLSRGLSPREVARSITKRVEGFGGQEGKLRAEAIARTETMRVLNERALDQMEALGATAIGAMVEWSTAGFDVCPLCEPLQGIVLTTREARGMIPRHKSCRCCFRPANVGESPKGQKRTKEQIEEAIALSVMAEIPEGSNRTLAEQRELSSWAGAKKVISATRAKPFVVGG